MPKTPSRCTGCTSYSRECKLILGSKAFKFHQLFREKYCPCTSCLVKTMCHDKVQVIFSIRSSHHPLEKCPNLKSKTIEFKEYLKRNGMRKTIFKKKKRKK